MGMNDNEIEMLHLHPAPEGVGPQMDEKFEARREEYARYDAAVSEWYTEGDGRPVAEGGRGYSFPECIHGMSSWTSYDNICGGCEEGYRYWDEVREMQDAYDNAVYAIAEWRKRRDVVKRFRDDAKASRTVLDADTLHAVFAWMTKPIM